MAKVSVISGEFNGLTIPQLWSTAYVYFFITLLFDLFGGFVKDNIYVRNLFCVVMLYSFPCTDLCSLGFLWRCCQRRCCEQDYFRHQLINWYHLQPAVPHRNHLCPGLDVDDHLPDFDHQGLLLSSLSSV